MKYKYSLENIKKAIEKIKDKHTYIEKFKKRTYYKTVKIWKDRRVYVPSSAYEQAGFVVIDPEKESKRALDDMKIYKGFYYQNSRPGTYDIMEWFIDNLVEELEKLEKDKDKNEKLVTIFENIIKKDEEE